MRLLSLKIHHFLRIKECTFHFDSQPLSFIEGGSDSGKTSFCEAVCFAFFGKTSQEMKGKGVACFQPKTQYIHWDATEAFLSLKFLHQEKSFRLERIITRDSGMSQFRLFDETDQEYFTECSEKEKQEALEKFLGWSGEVFVQSFFFPQQLTSPFKLEPLGLFREVAQMDRLQESITLLQEDYFAEQLEYGEQQKELELAQKILTRIESYEEESQLNLIDDFEEKKIKTEKKLAQQKEMLKELNATLRLVEQAKTNLEEYHKKARQLFKDNLKKKTCTLAGQLADYLESKRIDLKEERKKVSATQIRKKRELQESRLICYQIREFRRWLELHLLTIQAQLEDQLVRNPDTPKEELCLSPSRVAQLTYVQGEEEEVLRDNKIRNFMFFSVLFVLLLTTPVFLYLKNIESTYYRNQLKVQATGGFIVLLLLILIWYLSQKLKNNEILKGFNNFKVRLQEEISKLDQEYSLVSKYLHEPISHIELDRLPALYLRNFFKQLLIQAQLNESYEPFQFQLSQEIPTKELTQTRLPNSWDKKNEELIETLEEEGKELQIKLQEMEHQLASFEVMESYLESLSLSVEYDYEETELTLDELNSLFKKFQNNIAMIASLEALPSPQEEGISLFKSALKTLQKKYSLEKKDFPCFETFAFPDTLEELESWMTAQEKRLFERVPKVVTLVAEIEKGELLLAEESLQFLKLQAHHTLQDEKNLTVQMLQKEKESWMARQAKIQVELPGIGYKIQVKETLLELWKETIESMEKRLLPSIERMASTLLPHWTEGELGRVQILSEKEIFVFSREKNDFVAFNEFGAGRKQFIALTLHLSLAWVLSEMQSEKAKPFLLMDVPDLHLSSKETQEFFLALEKLGKYFSQIIITTTAAPEAKKQMLEVSSH